MASGSRSRDLLVDRFVGCFDRLADLTVLDFDSVAKQLAVGESDQFGDRHWKPTKFKTPPAAFDAIYQKLPGRLPRLFELLLISYRWAEVDLKSFRLLANPPGADLTGFLQEISRDPVLWKELLPAGYVQFGKGPDLDYDPVCFDLRSRKKSGDCRIVKIDHEQVLSYDRVKIRAELAPSFEELILRTIRAAEE
jgi:hypothetical protein